jgi:hypothetical protein
MPSTNLLKSNSIVVIPNNIHFGMVLTAIVKQIIDDMDNKHITLNLHCQTILKILLTLHRPGVHTCVDMVSDL